MTREPGVLRQLGRVGLALLVLLVVAAIGVAPMFPRSVTPAGAPADVFSAERALAQLPTIAAEPHPSGSLAQARVRDYLVQRLAALGLEPQVQRSHAGQVENVVARLRGTRSSGAVLVLAHYDSVAAGPGAADNGSGVVTLLETMRALVAGSRPRNDVIALFDDAEEDGFVGSQAFVNSNPWMKEVRVVVNLDTAVRGPIMINQTGPNNGWLVDVLARSFVGGAWTSSSGGGVYDYEPFRQAGIQGLDLEDNYKFYQQHTALDRPEIVNPGSVQQFGDQTLSLERGLGSVNLTHPWGEDQVFMAIPPFGLLHYPKTWALPLAALAAILFLIAVLLALRSGLATWAGLGVGLAAVVVTAGVAALSVSWLWSQIVARSNWDTGTWVWWPNTIPPGGEYFFIGFGILVLFLSVGVYLLARRITGGVNFALIGLALTVVLSPVLYQVEPRSQIVALWPALIGSIVWCGALTAGRRYGRWVFELAMLAAAGAGCLIVLPTFITSFMGKGLDGVAEPAAFFAILLAVVLPALDPAPAVPRRSRRVRHGNLIGNEGRNLLNESRRRTGVIA